MKKVWKYIEPMWLGTKGKLSIRRVLALAFSVDFIRNTHHAIVKWDAGQSYADLAMLLGVEAALIAALLSLTTYTNIMTDRKKDRQDDWGTPPLE